MRIPEVGDDVELEVLIVLHDVVAEEDAFDAGVVERVAEEDGLEAGVQLLADVLQKARGTSLNG